MQGSWGRRPRLEMPPVGSSARPPWRRGGGCAAPGRGPQGERRSGFRVQRHRRGRKGGIAAPRAGPSKAPARPPPPFLSTSSPSLVVFSQPLLTQAGCQEIAAPCAGPRGDGACPMPKHACLRMPAGGQPPANSSRWVCGCRGLLGRSAGARSDRAREACPSEGQGRAGATPL